MMPPDEAKSIREAMEACLPHEASRHGGDPPQRRMLYVPETHTRALAPDNMVVRGIRGAGKTFWWQSLRDDTLRAEVARRLPRARLGAVSQVVTGFGGEPAIDRHPDRAIMTAALGHHPGHILWRAVVLWALGGDRLPSCSTWAERFAWVAAQPEETARILQAVDREMSPERPILLVFDAIDRAADRWDDLVALHRGLLEVLLDLRQTRAIRGKAFLRADLLDEPGVTGFPDASKLLRDVVDLHWSMTDLYGLLWQYLGNARTVGDQLHPGAKAWRECVARESREDADLTADPWDVPRPARLSSEVQERLMEQLAGRWMGDPRRGRIYMWLPHHLMDGRRQISPRSFLVALQAAVVETPHDHPLPLDWRAIKMGVAAASAVRVAEITREQHPWVGLAAEPLKGLRIPAEAAEVFDRWRQHQTVDVIAAAQFEGPPPRRLHEGEEGLLADLITLGVVYRLVDGRIQMPDVYRVHFGLLRKGGVPVAR